MHGLAALALRDFAERTTLEADAGWHAQQERLRAADAFEPELPSTLRAELRPYQHDGFRWLARLARWGAGACLADDMGLGKTVQTLALLLDRAPDGPALVVAPTSVVANWLDEARRFTPTLNVIAYTGTASSRTGRLDDLGPFDVVVTTYGLLQIDVGSLSRRRVAQRGARRGTGGEESGVEARAGGAGAEGALSPGDHRHPRSRTTSWISTRCSASSTRGCSARRSTSGAVSQVPVERDGRRRRAGAAAPPHRAVRPAAAEDGGAGRPAAAHRDRAARRDVADRGGPVRGAAPARGGRPGSR